MSDNDGLVKVDMDSVYGMLRESGSLRKIRFRTQGGSMVPLIRRGDIVTVEPADAGGLKVGDVVLFHSGGVAVVHRMLYQYTRGGSTWLLTKGDALPAADAPVPAGKIIGRVVCVEREGRRLDLDRPVMKALSLFLALVSPAAAYYMPVARRLKSVLRGFTARP